MLRVSRSIQAEGVFAAIREDMNFRRFLIWGNNNVKAEWQLVRMAYNILKLHHKIQTGRVGNHLFCTGYGLMPQLRKQRTFLSGKMYPSVFVRCFFHFRLISLPFFAKKGLPQNDFLASS